MSDHDRRDHDHRAPKALFILKRREDYSTNIVNFAYGPVATGMFNSATFVSNMLDQSGVESKVVTVIDNNCIDREVHSYRPTHVFIEGYWVVPEKFDVLKRFHPNVKWIVRCHSELPFLAQEGIAMDWTFEYLKRGVAVAGNSPRIGREISLLAHWAKIPESLHDDLVPMLPNYYPVGPKALRTQPNQLNPLNDGVFDIACFGAIRPMKNHLLQAVSAVEFAKKHHRKLRFHINAGRVEMNGANSLKNLTAFFNHLGPDYQLIQHAWTSHEMFLKLIAKMDICMQVSFSESFNIVSADAVNVGVPIVVSKEVFWAYPYFADPNSSDNITKVMSTVWNNSEAFEDYNRKALHKYTHNSKQMWLAFFRYHPR